MFLLLERCCNWNKYGSYCYHKRFSTTTLATFSTLPCLILQVSNGCQTWSLLIIYDSWRLCHKKRNVLQLLQKKKKCDRVLLLCIIMLTSSQLSSESPSVYLCGPFLAIISSTKLSTSSNLGASLELLLPLLPSSAMIYY